MRSLIVITLKELFRIHKAHDSGRLETARFKIKGMTCRNCERTVKKALFTKLGVKDVYVSRDSGVASVTYDPAQTDVPQLFEVILRKGYVPGALED